MFVKNIPIGNLEEISASTEQVLQAAGVPPKSIREAKKASVRYLRSRRDYAGIEAIRSALEADRKAALKGL